MYEITHKSKKYYKKKGFTFIELMTVLAIIGILSLAVFPRFGAYFRSLELSEAKYNSQTIVYSIRDWSLGNTNNYMVPDNFSVKNSQGYTIIDYLKEYNREYYDKNLKSLVEPTLPLSPIYEVYAKSARYTLKKGELIVEVYSAPTESIHYNLLETLDLADRENYIQK